jgi:hypothetical protein
VAAIAAVRRRYFTPVYRNGDETQSVSKATLTAELTATAALAGTRPSLRLDAALHHLDFA